MKRPRLGQRMRKRELFYVLIMFYIAERVNNAEFRINVGFKITMVMLAIGILIASLSLREIWQRVDINQWFQRKGNKNE